MNPSKHLILVLIVVLACKPKQVDQNGLQAEIITDTTNIEKSSLDQEAETETQKEEVLEIYDDDIDVSKLDNIIEKISLNNPLPASTINLLQINTYHGDEIKDGIEKLEWYGLSEKEGSFYVEKVNVKINKVFDAVLDEEGDTTGKEVVVETENKPVILVNGLKGIKEGEVPAFDLKSPLYPGDTMKFEINNQWFYLYAYGRLDKENNFIAPYLLKASSSIDDHKTKQLFFASKGLTDTNFRFIWAGDLDSDGRLDLIMDISDHYNVSRIVLFLSSSAGEGEIFKLVAKIETMGC